MKPDGASLHALLMRRARSVFVGTLRSRNVRIWKPFGSLLLKVWSKDESSWDLARNRDLSSHQGLLNQDSQVIGEHSHVGETL